MAFKTEEKTAVKKKKKWIAIIAPKELNNVELGETPTYNLNSLIGKTIKTSLMTLTQNIKQQNVKLTFSVNEVKDEKAYTEVTGYELSQSFIKRITKTAKSKIDDSFLTNTKDNIKLILKPLILTRYKTNKSVLKSIRKKAEEQSHDICKKITYENLINLLITNKFQKDIKKDLNKIYPIKVFEIRIMKKIGASTEQESVPEKKTTENKKLKEKISEPIEEQLIS